MMPPHKITTNFQGLGRKQLMKILFKVRFWAVNGKKDVFSLKLQAFY